MNAAGIIAAGAGSRLRRGPSGPPKPLVRVAGRPLGHWVVAGLAAAGITRLTVLVNSRGSAVPPDLSAAFPALRFDFLTADTASSFESFRLVARRLAEANEAFLVSTVDALVPPADVVRFAQECLDSGAAAGLALTRFVDDERPLWAELAANGCVAALGEEARRDAVTCGLYYLTRPVAARLPAPAAHGALRGFWTELVRSGVPVRGSVLSKTLDVDRPEDVAAAEEFLAGRARP